MGPLIEGIELQQFSHEAAQELIYLLDDRYSGSVVCACASILRRYLAVHFARGDIRYNPCTHLWLPTNKKGDRSFRHLGAAKAFRRSQAKQARSALRGLLSLHIACWRSDCPVLV